MKLGKSFEPALDTDVLLNLLCGKHIRVIVKAHLTSVNF